MNTLDKIHTLTFNNRCFGQIYNNHEILEALELQVKSVDSGSVTRSIDELLLKLTTIHRFFQLFLSEKRTCEKLSDICSFLMANSITRKLVCCLEDKNQHVVFMASKALSSLMLSVPLTSTTKSQLREIFQGLKTSKWKSLYIMDILKQVIEGCLDDGAENFGVQSMTPFCNCVSGKREITENRESKNLELMEFIMSQDWISILPFYVPFWEDVFMSYIDNCSFFEGSNWTPIKCLEYQLSLSAAIPQKLTHCSLNASARDEQVFLTFLNFLTKFLHWTLILSSEERPSSQSIVSNCEINGEMFLLKVIPVMPYILNVKKLSSDIWEKIQKLLSYTLNARNANIFNKITNHTTNNTSIEKCIFDSAVTFISAIICHILDNIPVHTGSECFGGSTLKQANEISIENCKTEFPNSSVFRHASLLILQASLVLFDCGNQENVKFSQAVFKSISIWYNELLKIGTSDHSSLKAYQREQSNHSNHEIFHRESSNHSNPEVYQIEPSMILMDIFSEQDDEMIKMMLLLLQLFKTFSRISVHQDTEVIVNALNPHIIFQAFLKVICFDHSVLLDFLISVETAFLEYLMEYLHFVLHDWQGFCQNSVTALNGVEIHFRCSMKRHLQDSIISNPLVNESAAFQEEMVITDNEVKSEDLHSIYLSDEFGGLSSIKFAYGSDSEQESEGGNDDYSGDENFKIKQNNSDGLKYLDRVDIHGIYRPGGNNSDIIDRRNSISKDMTYNDDGVHNMDSACNSVSNHDDGVHNMDSACNSVSNHDDEGGNCDITFDLKSKRKYDVGDDITDMNLVGKRVADGDDDICTCKCNDEEGMDYDFGSVGVSSSTIPSESATASSSTVLANTMSTLIHTRIAVERLNKGSFFPYQVKPLINLLRKVENIYDGC